MLRELFAKKQSVKDSRGGEIDFNKLPKHIGIIMDGNGRWAMGKGLIRTSGHKAGVNTLKKILEVCVKIKLPVLTVYAFSTENWKRPKLEVDFLMQLFSSFMAEQLEYLCRDNVKVKFIGRVDELPGNLPKELAEAEELTRNNTGVLLNVAVNYGGKDEITTAVRRIAQQVADGDLAVADIDESVIEENLYTSHVPPVDLMIRTSGDIRLSNFLLWQAAYAEFWFTDTNWPDFTSEEFLQAIYDYQHRDRRFGGIKTEKK